MAGCGSRSRISSEFGAAASASMIRDLLEGLGRLLGRGLGHLAWSPGGETGRSAVAGLTRSSEGGAGRTGTMGTVWLPKDNWDSGWAGMPSEPRGGADHCLLQQVYQELVA